MVMADATATQPDVLALNQRAAEQISRVIAQVSADDLGRSTPCPDWDVQALLNHLTEGAVWLTSVMAPADAAPSADRPGDDAFGTFQREEARFMAAASAPGALERTYETPFGPTTGTTLVTLRLTDLLTHTWDLARAIGQPMTFDPNLYETGLAVTKPLMDFFPRSPQGFTDAVPVPDDAPPWDRYAGYSGRQP